MASNLSGNPNFVYRVLERVDRSAGLDRCWLAKFPTHDDMPRCYIPKELRNDTYSREESVARVLWEIVNGEPVGKGFALRRTCGGGNLCCNPAHHERFARKVVRRHGAKLDHDAVLRIRALVAAGAMTQVQLAAELGVTKSAVNHVVRGRRWKEAA